MELCVVLVVLVTVGGLALSGYLFAVRWVDTWKDAVSVENNAHLVLRAVVDDLLTVEQLVCLDDTTWQLRQPGRDSLVYRWRGEVLWRDDVRVNAVGTKVSLLRVVPSRVETVYALPGPVGVDTLLVSVHLVLSGRRQEIRLQSAVAVRVDRPWRLLPPL